MTETIDPKEKCLSCDKEVVKLFSKFHKSPLNGDTTKKRRKFTDETGRLWHGTKCPDCATKWRKERSELHISALNAELKLKLEE